MYFRTCTPDPVFTPLQDRVNSISASPNLPLPSREKGTANMPRAGPTDLSKSVQPRPITSLRRLSNSDHSWTADDESIVANESDHHLNEDSESNMDLALQPSIIRDKGKGRASPSQNQDSSPSSSSSLHPTSRDDLNQSPTNHCSLDLGSMEATSEYETSIEQRVSRLEKQMAELKSGTPQDRIVVSRMKNQLSELQKTIRMHLTSRKPPRSSNIIEKGRSPQGGRMAVRLQI